MVECNDVKCPIHGNVKVRGDILEGVVVSAKPKNTATVMIKRIKKVQKYERYKKERSKLHVHNPPCISAKEGDIVRIGETRKLSKTKNFVILEKILEKEKKSK